MKKNIVPPNQMGLPFAEAPYKPQEIAPPPPPILSRNIAVRPKWEVNAAGVIYPEIRFGGKYLEDAGFRIGCAISLTVSKNKVVLTPYRPNTDPEPHVIARLASIKTRRRSAAERRALSE